LKPYQFNERKETRTDWNKNSRKGKGGQAQRRTERDLCSKEETKKKGKIIIGKWQCKEIRDQDARSGKRNCVIYREI
jgi:hypothetical protein